MSKNPPQIGHFALFNQSSIEDEVEPGIPLFVTPQRIIPLQE